MARFKEKFIDDYAIGIKLARIGASKKLIAQITSIGDVYANNLVKKYGTESKQKPRYTDIAIRIHSSPETLASTGKIIKIYQYVDQNMSRSERLISTYETYIACDPGPRLSPEEALEIIDFYDEDGLILKTCDKCTTKYHSVLDLGSCPVCCAISDHSCDFCHEPIQEKHGRGRKRIFCNRPSCITLRGRKRKKLSA